MTNSDQQDPDSGTAGRWAMRMRRGLPALAIVLAALISTGRLRRSYGAEPGEADWAQAARLVRSEYRPGELVTFSPQWFDPLGRLHLGGLVSVDDATRMDEAKYPVVWEISPAGHRALYGSGAVETTTRRVGQLVVRRHRQDPPVVVTDFAQEFRSARVLGKFAKRPAVRLEEVGFEPHRCVRMDPIPGHESVVVFSNVPLGTELVGYVGLADVFTRRDIRDPGRLRVLIDGAQKTEVIVGVDDGWVRFAFPTEPGVAEVKFVAEGVGSRAHKRLVCFAAEARK